MKRGLARFVTVAVTLAVAVTGTVSSAAAVPSDDAVVVRQLHDTLANSADAGDITAADAALAELDDVLTDLSDGRRDLAIPARDETAAAREGLAEQFPDGARTLGVPSVPEALNMLLQKLLAALSELIDNLLGGGLPIPA
jgi:hypothetical protein